jgi:uncharacterized protein (DUF4415 family)
MMLITIYLITSDENNIVFLMTPSIVTANALSSGNGDVSIRTLTKFNSPDFELMWEDKFKDNIYSLATPSNKLSLFAVENMTPSLTEMRNIMFIRQELFGYWESLTMQSLARQTRQHWSEFDMVAMDQIEQSDPSTGSYTKMLEEYARIVDSPVEYVYKEMKLRIESDLMTKFRVQAQADKWKDEINKVTTESEIQRVRTEMFRDFWQNCYI